MTEDVKKPEGQRFLKPITSNKGSQFTFITIFTFFKIRFFASRDVPLFAETSIKLRFSISFE